MRGSRYMMRVKKIATIKSSTELMSIQEQMHRASLQYVMGHITFYVFCKYVVLHVHLCHILNMVCHLTRYFVIIPVNAVPY
jgi:hypothetical protein